jgi:hypothetical protein
MKLNKIKDIRADEFIEFASLPDMGRVGGLSSFLSQHLKTEQVAEVNSSDKHWVSYADGVVKSASDVYKISYDKRHRLLIFAGESQPQDPFELHRLCNMLLELFAISRQGDEALRRRRLSPRAGHRGAPGMWSGEQTGGESKSQNCNNKQVPCLEFKRPRSEQWSGTF